MNLDDIEDKLDKVLTVFEVIMNALAAMLLVGGVVGFVVWYVTKEPPMVVSDAKPPVICGKVAGVTIYC